MTMINALSWLALIVLAVGILSLTVPQSGYLKTRLSQPTAVRSPSPEPVETVDEYTELEISCSEARDLCDATCAEFPADYQAATCQPACVEEYDQCLTESTEAEAFTSPVLE